MSYNIVLTGSEIAPDDPEPPMTEGWFSVAENRITLSSTTSITVVTIPRGQRRVTLTRLSHDRAQLVVGGFKSVTVSITGPVSTIARLREAVL